MVMRGPMSKEWPDREKLGGGKQENVEETKEEV